MLQKHIRTPIARPNSSALNVKLPRSFAGLCGWARWERLWAVLASEPCGGSVVNSCGMELLGKVAMVMAVRLPASRSDSH